MSSWSPIALFLSLLLAGCGARKPPPPDLGGVPDFQLVRETGAAFASADELRNTVWIADFIFTSCPGPCPRMTQHMKHLQDALAGLPQVKLVSFTVDPARDTPPTLAAYARRFGADPQRWCFLTGGRDALHRLSRDAFLLGDVSPDLEHSTRFALVDRRARIRGYYGTGEPSFLARLLEDAKTLVKEN